MTQIIYRCTTATTVAAGGVITSGAVQLLPSWAPPIQYVGTTQPWHVLFQFSTTMVNSGIAAANGKIRQAKVRAYGRKSTLHSGNECFVTSMQTKNQYGAVRPGCFFIFTYRAIGEVVRP
jgi:hypothetical protein